MDPAQSHYAEGGCTCGAVRFALLQAPMFVHCCHCSWCQRETGSAFALNAIIESSSVTRLGDAPELTKIPSSSGRGQTVARCPKCLVAIWSHYSGAGKAVSFVSAGTLDDPSLAPPDIHIFTSSKQDWVVVPDGVPSVANYYDRATYWPATSLARYRQATAG